MTAGRADAEDDQPAGSTRSRTPDARMRANNVESRGFPFRLNVRYSVSRDSPVTVATLAIPPRASEMARSAYMTSPSSPPASASSSSAATLASSARCSRRNSVCALLRAGSLSAFRPALLRLFDVATLSSLVTAAQQDDQSIPDTPEIDPVARPDVDPQFLHSIADRFAVTKQPSPDSADPKQYRRHRTSVVQRLHPITKQITPGWRQIVQDLEFGHCSLWATHGQEADVALRKGTTVAPSRAASSCPSYHAISSRRISSRFARS